MGQTANPYVKSVSRTAIEIESKNATCNGSGPLSTWLSGRRVTLSACVVIASIQRHQVADARRDACLNVCTQGQAPQLFVIEELDEGKPQKSSPSAPILTFLSRVLRYYCLFYDFENLGGGG